MVETVPRSLTKRLAREFVRLTALSIVPLLGSSTLLYAFQTRLIFPGAATQGTPEADVIPPPGSELVRLTTAKGDRVVAIFGRALTENGQPHPAASNQPTLLYFYGNAMCLRMAVDYDLDRYRRLGVNVMIPDYVGYGLSGGSAGEAGCYQTADAAFEHLKTRPDVNPATIIVIGRSLGGAVAIDLAARKHPAGLVVFCTFTRMKDMVRRQVPILPIGFLLRHRFDSLAKIRRVTCPILIGHGKNDQIVPSEMSDRLAAAAKAPVTLFKVEGADHNDLIEVGADEVFLQLSRYIDAIRGKSLQKSSEGRDGIAENP